MISHAWRHNFDWRPKTRRSHCRSRISPCVVTSSLSLTSEHMTLSSLIFNRSIVRLFLTICMEFFTRCDVINLAYVTAYGVMTVNISLKHGKPICLSVCMKFFICYDVITLSYVTAYDVMTVHFHCSMFLTICFFMAARRRPVLVQQRQGGSTDQGPGDRIDSATETRHVWRHGAEVGSWQTTWCRVVLQRTPGASEREETDETEGEGESGTTGSEGTGFLSEFQLMPCHAQRQLRQEGERCEVEMPKTGT